MDAGFEPPGPGGRLLAGLLRLLPKNHFSYLFGELAHHPLPFGLQGPLKRWFARQYEIDLDEAERELADYRTLGDFFVRRLKPGSRPIEGEVVSPVDGRVTHHGTLLPNDRLLQAKGKRYSLAELLVDPEEVHRFSGGSYLTIYLAPHNYHRIHAPVEGAIRKLLYVPGALWPVNHLTVPTIDRLYARNERATTVIHGERGAVAVCKVGATNVGRIRLTYAPEFATNQLGVDRTFFDERMEVRLPSGDRVRTYRKMYEPPLEVGVGQDLAAFEMGSTVVCLFEKGYELEARPLGSEIRMGERLIPERTAAD